MTLLYQIFSTAIVSYVCTTMSILFVLPSSTHKLFSSENTTLNRIMTETELSLMGSISSASTLLVIPFCGYLLDKLGRKKSLLLFLLPQLLSWALIATVYCVEAFILSMFLCGLSGSIFLIVPVFVGEYCDPCIRGAMTSCFPIFHGLGMVMSYLLGGLFDYDTVNYIGLTMSFVGFILICFLKESPLYLMKRGFEEEAAKSIAFYKGVEYNSIEVIKQMANIRKVLTADLEIDTTPLDEKLSTDEFRPRQKIPILKYFAKSPSTRRALGIVLIVFTSVLFQGLVVVQVYAKPLLEEAIPTMTSTLSSVIFAIITVISGLFGAYLIDTAGRRILTICCSAANGLICVMLSTHIQYNWGPHWLSAVLIYLYSIAYSVGPGIIPIVLMGEVFLPEIKSFASMVCMEWTAICIFIITFIFNPLVNAYGLCPLFYLFAGSSFFTALFTYCYLPETKGLPVDVIHEKFMRKIL